MTLFLVALGTFLTGGLAALFAGRAARTATALGTAGSVAGGVLGFISALECFSTGTSSLKLDWSVPYGRFYLEIDPLSAFFLLPVFGLSTLAALYGGEYLLSYRERKRLGPPWFFFNLLVASMALVVVARNGILFLVAWEVMSLASFFLVTFEDEKEEVREAGWTYLVATHLGTAFLLALFILLGRESDSLDFDRLGTGTPGLAFLLALVGFGTKAGFMPFHVWLPEAHPAAPSHVSAVMSGVMIKMGIYGLVRTFAFLGPPPDWWGWVLVAIGASSGVLGVLFALAQHDLKRLLAYHSVENIGIIVLGLGLGLLGWTHGSPALAALGFAGGLLHVVNHALFKGLLFLGAGAVLHGTGTREIDHLGGLLKRMPVTGFCFLIGAAAISGLPPLNGFVSEFLIFLGAYRGGASLSVGAAVPAYAVIASLALIGGLAAACFTKAFGIVFLGEPRGSHAAAAREAGLAMRIPMVLLAAGCLGVGLLGPLLVPALASVAATFLSGAASPPLQESARLLLSCTWVAGGLLGLIALLAGVRLALLRGRGVGRTVTWDCGYAAPTPRMQYTASSFAQPLTGLFAGTLRTRERVSPPSGFFPPGASLSSETPDLCTEGIYRPAFRGIGWLLGRFRWLQTGRVHLYVLYVALTLLVLLVWKLA